MSEIRLRQFISEILTWDRANSLYHRYHQNPRINLTAIEGGAFLDLQGRA